MRMSRRMTLMPTAKHGTVSTVVTLGDTYRWLASNSALGWKTVTELKNQYGIGNGYNYFGGTTNDRNSCYIPVPAMGSEGKSKKVKIKATFYLPEAMTCRWAVTSSVANKEVYQDFGAHTDANQYAAGTFEVPLGTSATKLQEYTFEFPAAGIPKNTPFYIFIWGNASTNYAIHIQSNITVTVEY